MQTDSAANRPRTAGFVLRALAWSVAIFGLLRLEWVERHGLLPVTQLQGWLAVGLCGTPERPIVATLACSGADVIALCLGVILAYPARWRARLVGAAGGLALILSLNTLRIGTLGRLAASPALFNALHVYLWPAALSLAVAGYVFAWMRFADRRYPPGTSECLSSATVAIDTAGGQRRRFTPTRRFVLLAVVLLLVFTAAAPLYLQSTNVLSVAAFIARAAAGVLRLLGVDASATDNLLWTARGSFLVTQECISTPLIPVYLAAVFAFGGARREQIAALVAAVPLFVGLGIARLLVVALPAALVASPLLLIHAFFQILLAAVVVVLAALWRHADRGAAARRALLGAALGFAFVVLLGSAYTRGLLYAARLLVGAAGTGAVGPPVDDPQGAIALLPAFQVGLFLALWTAARLPGGWRRFTGGLAVLGFLQLAILAALPLVADRLAPSLLVQGIRAFAVAVPALLAVFLQRFRPPDAGAMTESAPAGAPAPASAYRRFWAALGESFPDLDAAASTRFYAQNEQRLFTEHFPPLAGLRIFKSDLWDEAKNTRILVWAARQGAHAFGVDISPPIVAQARRAFDREPLYAAVADIRALPFAAASFDAVYSMGTIEHFHDSERALAEMVRVLRPGGVAIVGVPNRHDPFLRPLLSAALQAVGLYAYGYEKSYSRRSLRKMLERAGLSVGAETAILFIPGWLRMLDLACHSWCRPLARLTGALVWPFVLLDRYVPAVRNHGYLLATVVVKPKA